MIVSPDDYEVEVTDETRFWLWSEVEVLVVRTYPRIELTRPSERFRVAAEVTEARYRQAHRETFDEADDVTHPLDPYWWTTTPSKRLDTHDGYTDIIVRRGGRVDS